jgi:hypothetical protein
MTPVQENLSTTSGRLEVGVVRQEIANLRKLAADGRYKEARKGRHVLSRRVLLRLAEAKTIEDYHEVRTLSRELLTGEKTLEEIPD